ncbi:hypothetical protein [Niallia oryzisoli]|uniref:hypothetical protein n=1 Tax=Niallia oryzisoli TaxID=1737571 RepID=UPI0037350082
MQESIHLFMMMYLLITYFFHLERSIFFDVFLFNTIGIGGIPFTETYILKEKENDEKF